MFDVESYIYKWRQKQSEKVLAHTNTGWQERSSCLLLKINFAPSSGKKVWHTDVIKYKKKRCLYSEVLYSFFLGQTCYDEQLVKC